MPIRPYQPGDEAAQAAIYNEASRLLPAFKPATADEVARRYKAGDFDPGSKLYAVENGTVVGYISFNSNGRISYPWCQPAAQAARGPLLDAALAVMRQRGLATAWAAYRADWAEPLAFLQAHGFTVRRELVNFVAELDRLPSSPPPAGWRLGPLDRAGVAGLPALHRDLFAGQTGDELEGFYLRNPWFDPAAGSTLQDASGATVGMAVAITDPRFADPTKVDANMPCFRLGAMGTETERHKRINGLFSCVFAYEAAGEILLAAAVRHFRAAGLTHAAAQAPSDQPRLTAFYDRHFRRQGAFPILVRALAG